MSNSTETLYPYTPRKARMRAERKEKFIVHRGALYLMFLLILRHVKTDKRLDNRTVNQNERQEKQITNDSQKERPMLWHCWDDHTSSAKDLRQLKISTKQPQRAATYLFLVLVQILGNLFRQFCFTCSHESSKQKDSMKHNIFISISLQHRPRPCMSAFRRLMRQDNQSVFKQEYKTTSPAGS